MSVQPRSSAPKGQQLCRFLDHSNVDTVGWTSRSTYPGMSHRNHCPNCLWSRHLDRNWCSACRSYAGATVYVPRDRVLWDALADLPDHERERSSRSEVKLIDYLDRLVRPPRRLSGVGRHRRSSVRRVSADPSWPTHAVLIQGSTANLHPQAFVAWVVRRTGPGCRATARRGSRRSGPSAQGGPDAVQRRRRYRRP
jgi:hypothetical protein